MTGKHDAIVTSGSTYDTFETFANSTLNNRNTLFTDSDISASTTNVGESNALNLVSADNGKFPFPFLS